MKGKKGKHGRHVRFGELELACAKLPSREAAWRASGGIVGIVVASLVAVPMLALFAAGGVGWLNGWHGEATAHIWRPKLQMTWAALTVVGWLLMIPLSRLGARQADEAGIWLYERGLVIVHSWSRREELAYDQITDVYFGDKHPPNRLLSALWRFAGGRNARTLQQMKEQRLSIEAGRRTVRVHNPFALYYEDSLLDVVDELDARCSIERRRRRGR